MADLVVVPPRELMGVQGEEPVAMRRIRDHT